MLLIVDKGVRKIVKTPLSSSDSKCFNPKNKETLVECPIKIQLVVFDK